jgi:hypothetical protein
MKYVVHYVNLHLFSLEIKLNEISFVEVPIDVQRCCTRCYEKLIIQVRQRHTNQTIEEEDDDNDGSTITSNQNSKHNDGKLHDLPRVETCGSTFYDFYMFFLFLEEWKDIGVDTFLQAVDKFNNDWTQIAELFHRSEESCRAFYLKQRKDISPNDDHVRNSQ